MSRRITVYCGIAAILTAGWYFLAYRPVSQNLARLSADTAEAERQMADFNQTLAELPRYLKTNESLEELRGRLNSSLFAKQDILKLFDEISGEAAGYKLQLIDITPPVSELLELNRQALAADEPQFLNITLHFEGDYISFARYVSRLEQKPYFRSVNSCVIRGNQLLQPTVDLSVSFKALIGTVSEG